MWTLLNNAAETPIGKLLCQLVIISLGGLAITHTYNFYTEEREKRAEKREEDTKRYWALRTELFDMYQERYVALVRMIRILSENDASYARRFYEDQFEKSIDRWSRNLNQYYGAFWFGPLNDRETCLGIIGTGSLEFEKMKARYNAFHYRNQGTKRDVQEEEKVIKAAHENCARYAFVGLDAFEEQLGIIEGIYKSPASLHYAFNNTTKRVRKIFGSDWERCFQRAEKVAEIELQKCSTDGVDTIECVNLAYEKELELKQDCRTRIVSDLSSLVGDRRRVKQNWDKLRAMVKPAP